MNCVVEELRLTSDQDTARRLNKQSCFAGELAIGTMTLGIPVLLFHLILSINMFALGFIRALSILQQSCGQAVIVQIDSKSDVM